MGNATASRNESFVNDNKDQAQLRCRKGEQVFMDCHELCGESYCLPTGSRPQNSIPSAPVNPSSSRSRLTPTVSLFMIVFT